MLRYLLLGLLLSTLSVRANWSQRNVALSLATQGKPAAFGDYNGDKFNDVLFMEKKVESSAISVWLYNDKEGDFKQFTSVDVFSNLVGLIATDWNYDAKLDVIAIVGDDSTMSYRIMAYKQEADGSLTMAYNGPEYSSVHPFVADVNNDGRPDLIGRSVGTVSDPPERIVWLNTADSPTSAPFAAPVPWKSLTEFVQVGEEPMGLLSSPHSSAYVDMNGDCKPDLVFDTTVTVGEGATAVTQRQLEVWTNSIVDGKAMYVREPYFVKNPIVFPQGAGQATFGDFNADGTIDVIVPHCTRAKNSIEPKCVGNSAITMYAIFQTPMCTSVWMSLSSNCRKQSALCVHTESFAVEAHTSRLNVEDTTPVDETEDDATGEVAPDAKPVGPVAYEYAEPLVTLRSADYNSDGKPDIVVVVRPHAHDASPVVRLLRNKLVDGQEGPLSSFMTDLDFVPEFGGGNAVPYTAAFFDVYEDGNIDVLAFGQYTDQQPTRYTTGAITQIIQTDVFFLKATSLNGACYAANCPDGRKPYGVGFHGSTFKITVTDINGSKSPRTAVQLSQSAYSALGLPFVFFGLGRTNNYIEEFYMGVGNKKETHSNMWISLIPNTQVIAIPYPITDPPNWELELVVSPSRYFWVILTVTLLALIVVGGIIFQLDRKEKAEDLKEQQEKFRVHFISA